MRVHQWGVVVVILAMLGLGLLPGCGGSAHVTNLSGWTPSDATRELSGYATLQPFNDAWPSSAPRFWDVGDIEFLHATGPATIEVKYDPAPTVPYFVGAIKATGLKPNFCYQLKLMGKPGVATSSRAKPAELGKPKPPPDPPDPGLWGDAADMDTNEALLRAGRWWNYKTEDPAFTTTNDDAVLGTADYQGGWVAGYLYFGFLMTDGLGQAAWSTAVNPLTTPATLTIQGADTDGWVPIASAGSFHITGKDSQGITQSTTKVTHTSVRPAISYGSELASSDTPLWLEKETDDPIAVALPNGTHDVLLMLTEESFHQSGLGGYWESVYVSDWSSRTSPVSGLPWIAAPGSPIVFTVGGENLALVATTTVRWAKVRNKWQPRATVTVAHNGVGVSGVVVDGFFSGAYNATVSGTTSSSGDATFNGPTTYSTTSFVAFDTTAVTKTGYSLDTTNSVLHAEASQ